MHRRGKRRSSSPSRGRSTRRRSPSHEHGSEQADAAGATDAGGHAEGAGGDGQGDGRGHRGRRRRHRQGNGHREDPRDQDQEGGDRSRGCRDARGSRARRGELRAAGGRGAREVEDEPRRARRPRLDGPRFLKPFVLVHGAGGGGWCWDAVAPALREAGHEVLTPDLELRDADTTAEDHAQQVIDAIGDLADVVLVGHSYGGMPIAVVTDRVPERLARGVYLDAFAPRDGDCAWTERPALERFMTSHASDDLIPPIPPEYVGADPEHYEFLRKRLTTTPLRCLAEPVVLTRFTTR